jgi:hypothetical protein
MILLSFSGFLRYDEVSSLRFNYVKVHDNHLVLHLEKSKTDQYRQSSDVLIAKGSAVRMTHCLASLLSIMQLVLAVHVWHSDRVVK